MTATDVKTAQLHRRLTEALDTETADALIERLPPDWEKLATKEGLKEFAAELRGEISKQGRVIAISLTGFALAFMALVVALVMSGAFSSAG